MPMVERVLRNLLSDGGWVSGVSGIGGVGSVGGVGRLGVVCGVSSFTRNTIL
jgi:hypothetical protein